MSTTKTPPPDPVKTSPRIEANRIAREAREVREAALRAQAVEVAEIAVADITDAGLKNPLAVSIVAIMRCKENLQFIPMILRHRGDPLEARKQLCFNVESCIRHGLLDERKRARDCLRMLAAAGAGEAPKRILRDAIQRGIFPEGTTLEEIRKAKAEKGNKFESKKEAVEEATRLLLGDTNGKLKVRKVAKLVGVVPSTLYRDDHCGKVIKARHRPARRNKRDIPSEAEAE